MKYYREILLALLAGAVSGALVLGIVGRAATAGVALVIGDSLNLSLKGVLEVVIIGMFVGAVGGILLLMLKNVFRGDGLTLGVIVGLIMFVCSTIFVIISGRVTFDMSFIQFFVFGVSIFIFVIYGILSSALLTRFNRYWRKF